MFVTKKYLFMKKIYTLMVMTIAGLTVANAQRNVDWSLDEILEPTEITSSQADGSTVPFTFVLKNLGPDSAIAGDTVLVQMGLFNSQNQAIAIAPSSTTFYFTVLTKTLNTGDTIHFSRSPKFNVYPILSMNVTVRGITFIRNGSDPIAGETSPGADNNLNEKQVVWYNPQGWGVSVGEVANDEIFSSYPNPATDVLNFEWQMASAGNEKATLKIFSIDGKLVKTETLDGFGHGKVSVSDLPAGMYFVEFESGAIKSTRKIQIK